MSKRELRRVGVLARVASEELKLVDAAKILSLSYRQGKRIWQRLLPVLRSAPSPIPRVFLITATPLNLHKRFPHRRLPSNSCIGRAPHDLPNLPAFLADRSWTRRATFSSSSECCTLSK